MATIFSEYNFVWKPSQGETPMTEAKLNATIRKPEPEVSVIDLQGEVTGQVENALMDAFAEASNGTTKTIILNFNELEYMNSSGIGLLVTLLIRTQRQKQHLLACGLSEHYQEIFTLTRLDEAITTYNSEAEARAGNHI
jgi:anti-sigma B factor antagonist